MGIRKHGFQPSRERKSSRCGSERRFSVRFGVHRDPDLRADFQGDLGEAPESQRCWQIARRHHRVIAADTRRFVLTEIRPLDGTGVPGLTDQSHTAVVRH